MIRAESTPDNASTSRTTSPIKDHAKRTQITPSVVSPTLAAQSRCRFPCPNTMSTGNATIPTANTTVPTTKPAVDQETDATTVHHGTANSNSNTRPIT